MGNNTMTDKLITKQTIYDMAEKGIILYQSGRRVFFKIDIDLHPLRNIDSDNRLRQRIESRTDDIIALLDEIETETRALLKTNSQLSSAQWALAIQRRVIDFSEIQRYLKLPDNSFGKFTELDFKKVSDLLTALSHHFSENHVIHFMRYMESRV